jgi:hypothetical protein
MMGLIGVSIGLVGFFLHQVIHLIAEIKWEIAERYIQVIESCNPLLSSGNLLKLIREYPEV